MFYSLVGPDKSQEPGIPSGSSTWTAGAQAFEPSLVGSHPRHVSAGSWNVEQSWDSNPGLLMSDVKPSVAASLPHLVDSTCLYWGSPTALQLPAAIFLQAVAMNMPRSTFTC